MGCVGSRPPEIDKSKSLSPTAPVHQLVNVVTDRDIHEAYDFTGPVLGKGSFATVLRVRDRMSGSEYAVKQIDLTATKDDPAVMKMLENECNTMMALSHPNIVRLQEVYRPTSGDAMYLVLDRLEGGSVEGLWREQGKLSEDHAAHIMLQVVSAVHYCHQRNIAHRDLKMENSVFEDASLVPIVKIIDFGLCAELKKGVTSRSFVGTVLYTAPEVLKVAGHGLACDLWSVGVMAFALVSGEFPWFSKNSDICGNMIKYSDLKFPQEVWKTVSPLCRDFIEKCLVKNPKKRITAAGAHQHPWLTRAARAMERTPLTKDAMRAMMNYQNGNSFKRIAMELVAYSYDTSQIKDLELIFLQMDTRGDGVISLKEFTNGLLDRWNGMDKSQRGSKAGRFEPSGSNTRFSVGNDSATSAGNLDTATAATAAAAADKSVHDATMVAATPAAATATTARATAATTTTTAAAAGGESVTAAATAATTSTTNTSQLSAPLAESENEISPPKEDNEDEVDHRTLYGALNVLQAIVGQDSVKYSATSRVERRDALLRTLSASFRTSQHPRAIAINSRHEPGGTAATTEEGTVETATPAFTEQETKVDHSSSGDADRSAFWRRREWGSTFALGVSGKRLTLEDVGSTGGVLEGESTGSYRGAATRGTGKAGGDELSSGSIRTLPSIKNLDEKAIEEMFNAMDHDKSGSITFTDFVAGCLVQKQVSEAAVRTAFDRLDHSRSGLISLEDVKLYMGEDFDEEEMKRNMRAISSRDDGQVSYKDFKKCLVGGALPNPKSKSPARTRMQAFKTLVRPLSKDLSVSASSSSSMRRKAGGAVFERRNSSPSLSTGQHQDEKCFSSAKETENNEAAVDMEAEQLESEEKAVVEQAALGTRGSGGKDTTIPPYY